MLSQFLNRYIGTFLVGCLSRSGLIWETLLQWDSSVESVLAGVLEFKRCAFWCALFLFWKALKGVRPHQTEWQVLMCLHWLATGGRSSPAHIIAYPPTACTRAPTSQPARPRPSSSLNLLRLRSTLCFAPYLHLHITKLVRNSKQSFGGFVMILLSPRFPASPWFMFKWPRCQLQRDAYSGDPTEKKHSFLQQENSKILKDRLPFVFSHLNGLLDLLEADKLKSDWRKSASAKNSGGSLMSGRAWSLWSVSPSPTQRVTLGKSSDLGSSLPARGRSNGQCSQVPSHPSSLGFSLYSWQQWRVIFLKVILGGDLADIQLVVDVCLMQLVSLFLVTFYMSLHRILRCLGWKGHKNQSGCNSFF